MLWVFGIVTYIAVSATLRFLVAFLVQSLHLPFTNLLGWILMLGVPLLSMFLGWRVSREASYRSGLFVGLSFHIILVVIAFLRTSF